VTRFDPPLGPGVRVDTHAFTGYRIPPTYDSLLAKVIVHAEDRESCIARSQRALGELNVEGVKTTRDLHLDVLGEARFRLGMYTTSYIEEAAADLPHLGTA
jgi:acetyl-CoA carboxylase biotin carboxylase subunit